METIQPIRFKDVIDLGFNYEQGNDKIHIDQYGYDWFWCEMKLHKQIFAYWDCDTRYVELRRQNKDGDILSRIEVKDLDELKKWIEFFKGNKIK